MGKLELILRNFVNKYNPANYILNTRYFPQYKGNFDNIYQMAAAVGPDGVTTHQESGEIYTAADQAKVLSLPIPEKEQIDKNLLTGQYIDQVYRELMNSEEGKAFVEYLKKYGNGRRKPGSIDDIFVKNLGDGVVAATMPEHVRGNIIINADYIHKWARDIERRTGMPYKEAIKAAIIHEIGHYDWQPKSDMKKPVEEIEFNNDYSNIRFYVGLANKNIRNQAKRDLYIGKAELLASRYGGKAREFLENYMQRKLEKEKSIEKISNNTSLEYRIAA